MEWLKEILGEAYTGEIDKKISEEIGKGFVARADFNAVNETKKALDAQIKERDKDIAALKTSAGENGDLQQKYADLQSKYKADTEAAAKSLADMQKQSAVDLAIIGAKGRNPKAIKALLDMDKISLKDDGSLDGLDLAALRQSDAYLFEVEQSHTEGSGYDSAASPNSETIKTQFEKALNGQ